MAVRNTPELTLRMQTALCAGKHTYKDLSAMTGLAVPTVTRWIKTMRTIKTVHVSGWAADDRQRPVIAMFSWGNKKDAARPGPRPSADRVRRLRERRSLGL